MARYHQDLCLPEIKMYQIKKKTFLQIFTLLFVFLMASLLLIRLELVPFVSIRLSPLVNLLLMEFLLFTELDLGRLVAVKIRFVKGFYTKKSISNTFVLMFVPRNSRIHFYKVFFLT